MPDQPMKKRTSEEQEAVSQRVQGFNEKFKAILGEYNLALTAVAVLTPDGRIMARPQLLPVEDLPPQPHTDEVEPADTSGLASAE